VNPHKHTAYHEAGHATVAWRYGCRIEAVSIVPGDDGSLGRCISSSLRQRDREQLEIGMTDSLATKIDYEIMVCLAGAIAQRIHNPRSFRRYQNDSDNQSAVDLAFKVAGSDTMKFATVDDYLKDLHVRTKDVLQESWAVVEAIAAELLHRKTINGSEIDRIARRVASKSVRRRNRSQIERLK